MKKNLSLALNEIFSLTKSEGYKKVYYYLPVCRFLCGSTLIALPALALCLRESEQWQC